MDIDIALSAEDHKRLAQAVGSSWSADEVAVLLARAGASEILALATGRTVPATLAETRAFRIFNLLQQGMNLSDAESLVAAIFKVPSATAKRMVNAAVARYAVELQQRLSGTIGEVLDAATWDKEQGRGVGHRYRSRCGTEVPNPHKTPRSDRVPPAGIEPAHAV